MVASKSLLVVLFFVDFISASSAYVFTVGGSIGWVENPPVPYSNWSGNMRFSVNDTLVFNYKQGDSVLVVKKESYDSCNVTNPLQKLDSGVYKLDHSGPHYFISGAAGHCSNGEKLLIVVLAIRSPPSPPALAPPAPAPVVSPAPSSLPPSPSPASVTAPAPAPLSPSPSPVSVTAPAPAPSSLSPSPASVTAPAPSPSSLSPSPSPVSVTAPAPAPSSLSPSPASVTAPAPSPFSLSPSPSPASVTAPAPAPSSLSPSPASVPAPGPSSVSPAPSSSSPSPGSVPVKSPPQPGSAPSGSPSGSLAPQPSTNSSPFLRMSFGLVALVIGCTLMI